MIYLEVSTSGRELGRKLMQDEEEMAYALETTEGESFRHHLLMRPNNVRKPSHEYKRKMLTQVRSMGYHPILAFDDRGSDTQMYRSKGILCMQVSERDF